RVYFGVNSPDYSIVGGDRKQHIEIDYPADEDASSGQIDLDTGEVESDESESDEDAEVSEQESEVQDPSEIGDEEEVAVDESDGPQNMTTFAGDGGPVLKGVFEKLLYALKFQDIEIL